MELEVGMYCFCKQRRNLGIGKILNISKYGNVFVQFKNYVKVFVNSDLKTSHNIIDLVEVGDYVNGYKVLDILKGFKILVDKLELNTRDGNYYLKQFANNEIKSVVTEEVFKANEYRVEAN